MDQNISYTPRGTNKVEKQEFAEGYEAPIYAEPTPAEESKLIE